MKSMKKKNSSQFLVCSACKSSLLYGKVKIGEKLYAEIKIENQMRKSKLNFKC